MSTPSTPQSRLRARRRRHTLQIEGVQQLEGRQLLAPYLPTNGIVATFVPDGPAGPTGQTGAVTITAGALLATSAAAYTSVSQFTPISSFGGNIVRIEAGPGGDFGKGVYAITRGAGDNAGQPGVVDRPGVIYRVDPATGVATVFFDLNTVQNQLAPNGTADAALLPGTGLINWYDLAFDIEGYFDGRPSLFVTSADRSDPNKNAVFRIGPDGEFLGLYIRYNDAALGAVARNPTAILVPPPEQQDFFRGLFVGDGASQARVDPDTGLLLSGNEVVFYDANAFRPGQAVGTTLPFGARTTPLVFGPQVALIASNTDYNSPVFSAFTDFGIPQGGGLPGAPGLSGIQGLNGELLVPGIDTTLRRYQDLAFDYYGYFSYGTIVTPGAAGARPTVGLPIYAGNLFAADLGTGLSVTVLGNQIPVQGPTGPGGTGVVIDPVTGDQTFLLSGGNIGGRIVRITPDGVITSFAEGFNTSGSYFADSFVQSSLSITFSADGTIMYAADDDGIWQFKTVTSLASSTSGTIVGLNDLRTFGVPYEGQDSAVAVVDSGIDRTNPNFRGRVAPGRNVFTNGRGDDDDAPANVSGHGTLVAGVIHQFVPQATLEPVTAITPLIRTVTITDNDDGVVTPTADSTFQIFYNGLQFTQQNPFVPDPIRPNKTDRVIAANIGLGTTRTYETEASAYRQVPQAVIAFKNQFKHFRDLGIAPISAAGDLSHEDPTVAFPNPLGHGNPTGMTFPAVLNEVISVTGTYSFPITVDALTTPDDPFSGFLGRIPGPVLVYGNNLATPIAGTTAATLVTADTTVFKDKLLSAANRSVTTDFAAPEIDLPTFSRTFVGDLNVRNVFTEGGTSLSAGVVTGSYAVVSSALDYWSDIARDGVTVDGYLTTPVGTRQLNFGQHVLYDLKAYNNPDGINSILQWTAVPAADDPTFYADALALNDTDGSPNGRDVLVTPLLFGNTGPRNFSRIDVGNAIAAIEGTIALRYLIGRGLLPVIDSNGNGLITAQEVQSFNDRAATIGLPEAGAVARFLGGTFRTGNAPLVPGDDIDQPFAVNRAPSGFTLAGENPDQPDALQRRFNFFDYASDGQLNGSVSIDQLVVLSHYLLPTPDAFVVVDRPRASNNKYLVDADALRNISDLQHLKPRFVFVPKSAVERFRGISPRRFGINKRINEFAGGPFFTLFNSRRAPTSSPSRTTRPSNGGSGSGSTNGGARTPAQTPTTTPTTTPTQTPTTPTIAAPQPVTTGSDAVADALRRLVELAGATAPASGTSQQSAARPITAETPAIPASSLAAPTSATTTPTTTAEATPTAVTTPTTETDATPVAATTSGAATASRGARRRGRLALQSSQGTPNPNPTDGTTAGTGATTSSTRRGGRVRRAGSEDGGFFNDLADGFKGIFGG